jgi:class 3 adenylate cyclase/tetratricopeptide (TPR) repeat protein
LVPRRVSRREREDLQRAFAEAMGAPVEVVSSETYAEMEAQLIAGEADVAWAPPTVIARAELYGASAVVRFSRANADRYCAAVIGRADLEDAALTRDGLRCAWLDPDSLAGYLLPRAWLMQNGARPAELDEAFHDSLAKAIRAVADGDADVCGVFAVRGADAGVRVPMLAELSEQRRAKLRLLGLSDDVPNDGLAVAPRFQGPDVVTLRERFLEWGQTPRGRRLLEQVFQAEGLMPIRRGGYQKLYPLLLGKGAENQRLAGDWLEEQKLATVLFLDISGFTATSSVLPPDRVREYAAACLGPLAAEIEGHGGTVVKYIGDAIMAVFGVPRAAEDDAVRAVRAALGVVRRAREISPEIERRFGGGIEVRVGVNTGTVMVGRVGAGDRHAQDVMGRAVNLASRLENVAAPGEVWIGPDTRRAVGGRFEIEQLDPVSLKGFEELIAPCRVIAPMEPTLRGPNLDDEVPLRPEAIARLLEVYAAARDEEKLHAVSLVGEPGMGKGWVLRSLAHRLSVEEDEAPFLLAATCALGPAGAQSPLGAVRQLLLGGLARAAGVDPAVLSHAELVAAFTAPLGEDHAARLDVDDAEVLARVAGPLRTDAQAAISGSDQTRVFTAFWAWLSMLASSRPTVLLFRELQWLDGASAALIGDTFSAARDLPIVMVLSMRPEGEGQWSALRFSRRFSRVALEPLEGEIMRAFLDALLKDSEPEVLATLTPVLAERAEGSPAYAKELFRLLLDRGALVPDGDGFRLEGGVDQVELPPTVRGVLQARLDGLGPAAKDLVRAASVMGRTFSIDALAARWIERRGALDTDAILADLLDKNLIRRVVADETGAVGSFAFRSQALRDIAYQSLPGAERRGWHRAVAEWLDAQVHASHAGYADLAAHWDAAGDPARAARVYLIAARGAAAVEAHEDAVRLFELALARWPVGEDAADRADAVRERALVLANVGRFDEALGALGDAHAALAAAGLKDSARLVRLDLDRARVLKDRGHRAAAASVVEEARSRTSNEDPLALRIDLIAEDAFLRAGQGDLEGAIQCCEAGLALVDSDGVVTDEERLAEARLRDTLALVFMRLKDFAAAERAILAAQRLRRQAGDRRGELLCANNLGGLAFETGDFQLAVARFESALESAETIGRVRYVAMCLANLGRAELAAGIGDGKAHLMRALRVASRADVADVAADAAANLAEAVAETDVGEARSYLTEALRWAEDLSERARAEAHLAAARVELRDGEPLSRRRAKAHVDEAQALLGQAGEERVAQLRARLRE